ncbi:MAG: AAA family ATPase, partial [Firmicutes bacterium]|nr:AAA family ATPase [Bacillota bacterium]
MKIRRLYLGDFGILRNQTLDDIGQGLIVIGGPNRAGKTSFMQVLRYLGYGFPRGGNLPPATHEYHVEATISLESDIWDLRLRGYGNPQVSGVGGRTTDASTLFGGLDMFTYHQLFTISLDELRLLPEGVEKGEGGALQSVLLGAGLADVARIPGIVKELDKEADRIGASRGRPHVREFKPYNEIIRENAKERDGALERLDEYQTHMQELADIKNRIDEVQEQLLGYRHQRTRLETLLHNHDDYHRWVEL